MDGGFYRTAARSIRLSPRLFQLQLVEADAVVASKTLLLSSCRRRFAKTRGKGAFSRIIFEKPRLLFWKNGEFFCKVQVHCPFG
jgi:hypothetical protein